MRGLFIVLLAGSSAFAQAQGYPISSSLEEMEKATHRIVRGIEAQPKHSKNDKYALRVLRKLEEFILQSRKDHSNSAKDLKRNMVLVFVGSAYAERHVNQLKTRYRPDVEQMREMARRLQLRVGSYYCPPWSASAIIRKMQNAVNSLGPLQQMGIRDQKLIQALNSSVQSLRNLNTFLMKHPHEPRQSAREAQQVSRSAGQLKRVADDLYQRDQITETAYRLITKYLNDLPALGVYYRATTPPPAPTSEEFFELLKKLKP